jgi:hypothetical protein
VILKQQEGWTYGILANRIWSFADAGGRNDRPEVDQMFLQPFFAYTWKGFHHAHAEQRVDLQLDGERVDGPDQSHDQSHL